MHNLPLSERPGFIPLPPVGTPEFSAFVRAAFCDPDANAWAVRTLEHLATQHTQPMPEPVPAPKGA